MIDAILSRLEKVKRTGRGSWLACCPAHEDRTPSLTLREADDGRILVHCFGGCSFESISSAVGVELDAWFPKKPLEHVRPERRPFPAADVLAALADEVLIVWVLAEDMAQGKPMSEEDRKRLNVAIGRIREAREVALGQR